MLEQTTLKDIAIKAQVVSFVGPFPFVYISCIGLFCRSLFIYLGLFCRSLFDVQGFEDIVSVLERQRNNKSAGLFCESLLIYSGLFCGSLLQVSFYIQRVAFPTHSRSVWDTTHPRKLLCVVHLNFRKSLTEIPRNGCSSVGRCGRHL